MSNPTNLERESSASEGVVGDGGCVCVAPAIDKHGLAFIIRELDRIHHLLFCDESQVKNESIDCEQSLRAMTVRKRLSDCELNGIEKTDFGNEALYHGRINQTETTTARKLNQTAAKIVEMRASVT